MSAMNKKQRKHMDCKNWKSFEEKEVGVLNGAVVQRGYMCKKKWTSTSDARGGLKCVEEAYA